MMVVDTRVLDSAVNDDAHDAIAKYCAKRNYKCKGCRYSIDFLNEEHSKYIDCIFNTCPVGWDNYKFAKEDNNE